MGRYLDGQSIRFNWPMGGAHESYYTKVSTKSEYKSNKKILLEKYLSAVVAMTGRQRHTHKQTCISWTEGHRNVILLPLNSTHKISYNYTLRQHPWPSSIGEKNTWEGIWVVSLSDLTDQWEVPMSPMIQKFQLDLNINLTKNRSHRHTDTKTNKA